MPQTCSPSWTYVGPDDPLAPAGEKTLRQLGQCGVLVAVEYEDGTLYQVQVQIGDRLNPQTFDLAQIPDAQWAGVGEDGKGGLFMTFWVARSHN